MSKEGEMSYPDYQPEISPGVQQPEIDRSKPERYDILNTHLDEDGNLKDMPDELPGEQPLKKKKKKPNIIH
jgi:hypothetical protein